MRGCQRNRSVDLGITFHKSQASQSHRHLPSLLPITPLKLLGWGIMMILGLKVNAQTTQECNERLPEWGNKAYDFISTDKDSAEIYARKTIPLALRCQDDAQLAYAISVLGRVNMDKGNWALADTLFRASLAVRKRMGIPKDIASGTSQLGWLKYQEGKFREATEFFKEGLALLGPDSLSSFGLKIKEGMGLAYHQMGMEAAGLAQLDQVIAEERRLKDTLPLIQTYLNIGNTLQEMNRIVPAIAYYKNALAWAEQYGATELIAMIQQNWGVAEYQLRNWEQAHAHLQVARQLAEAQNQLAVLNDIYNNLALVLIEQGKFAQAETYFEQDYRFRLQQGHTESAAQTAINWAEGLHKNGRTADALHWAQQAQQLQPKEFAAQSKLYQLLSDLHQARGEYQEALQWANREDALQASLERMLQNSQNLTDQFLMAEQQRKEAEHAAATALAQLEKERAEAKSQQAITFSIIFMLILLGVVAGLILRSHFKKLRYEAKERMRMEAHRQKLREAEAMAVQVSRQTAEQERQRIAKNLHDSLGSKLSVIQIGFQNLQQKLTFPSEDLAFKYTEGVELLDFACDEVRKISKHMAKGDISHFGLHLALEKYIHQVENQVNLPFEFKWTGRPPKLQPEHETEIFAALSTAISNIIQHAEATRATLTIEYHPQKIIILLGDNGRGFLVEKARKKEGMGLRNMSERIQQLGGTHQVISQPGEGTTHYFEIPIHSTQD